MPAVWQSRPPSLINEAAGSSGRAGAGRAASAAVARGATGGSASYAGQSSSGGGDDEDAQMRAAMAMSLEGATQQASRYRKRTQTQLYMPQQWLNLYPRTVLLYLACSAETQ